MSVEATLAPAGPGSVVLDIGGKVGAAVVYAPATLLGREIEIRAAGAIWDGRHVAVHRRDLPAGPVHAAVFPQLDEGEWEARVRNDALSPSVSLAVTGGRVTYVTLGRP